MLKIFQSDTKNTWFPKYFYRYGHKTIPSKCFQKEVLLIEMWIFRKYEPKRNFPRNVDIFGVKGQKRPFRYGQTTIFSK